MAEQQALPKDFVNLVKPLLADEWDAFADALSNNPSVSIRLNSIKNRANINKLRQIPWCSHGFLLPFRPQFTFDPLLHCGQYYVQEASSMFLYQALLQTTPENATVLDMCAAPGGKSTLIKDYLSNEGFLIANEYVSQRAHILAENLTKWGDPNFVVTNNSPVHFEKMPQLFDTVCVDAPCSGEGMFRKDPQAIQEWSLENVRLCVGRQREILQSAWKVLKPGGYMIFSTCTYNRHENEENVAWLIDNLDAEYIPLKTEPQWNITETELGYHFYPHKTKGEGLFMAVVRKNGDSTPLTAEKFKNKKTNVQLPILFDGLKNSDKFTALLHKGIIYCVAKDKLSLVMQTIDKLNVMTFGIPMAEQKGKDLIPQTGLALSNEIDKEKFTTVDVDYSTALAFLRSEAIKLENVERGYVLITYKDQPLGWVKNIGNRCNNLYPSPWRIRTKPDIETPVEII